MKTKLSLIVAGCVCALAGCSAGSESLSAGPLANAGASSKGSALTAGMTASEKQGKADGNDPRDQYPNAYGFTNPPAVPGAVAGEFEPISNFYIGWGSGAWENEQFFVDVIKSAATEVPVTIIVPDQQTANALDEDLSRVGADTGAVTYLIFTLDSIWMRDYGPLAAATDSGAVNIIDPRYYWGRWMDDYFPTALAGALSAPVARPPIEMEGGNFQSDGAGHCVATDAHVERNVAFGYDAQDIKDLFAAYYGCKTTTLVPALLGEGTGHVDMSVHVTGPLEVIVGSYPVNEDATNAARLDRAAAMLQADGFTVRRVGMPFNSSRSVFRSYTNALAVNGKVLVPVYDEDTRFEAAALAVFKQAYPDRQIVPINSDSIIQWAGAIHCVTMTFNQ